MQGRWSMTMLLGALVLPAALAAGGAGGRPGIRPFLGLWEGVDVNDGSQRTISISDRDGDGIVEVSARDTFWTLCDGDRGLEQAAGSVGADGVLTTEGVVACFDGTGVLPVEQTYELSRSPDTLRATAHGTGLVPIILHRVSE